MRLILLAPLCLAACWKIDAVTASADRVAYLPGVGAPEGWWVEGFSIDLACPDGQLARTYVVYPDSADLRLDPAAAGIPAAIVFHDGPFDYVVAPTSDDPTAGATFRTEEGDDPRLNLEWAAQRVFAGLGLYPNFDADAVHAGSLPAALAARGVVSIWPANCWGDWWHNRRGIAENNFPVDLFFRDGRTMAEFTYQVANGTFTAGGGLDLPVAIDTDRLYMVGLGEGARAVSELLALTDAGGGPLYPAQAVVVDSLVDNLRVYSDNSVAGYQPIQAGLNRIFVGTNPNTASVAAIPSANLPARLGVLLGDNDPFVPDTANDLVDQRFGTTTDPAKRVGGTTLEVWRYQGSNLAHPLSNADAGLAKAVADFLTTGLSAVDDAYED
ncbi:MAG: hypothetical protein H6733_08135 [Alphaproteobacteria bacterium]|nr:hypothetical protein [Alphaproteobacteria bacterium]